MAARLFPISIPAALRTRRPAQRRTPEAGCFSIPGCPAKAVQAAAFVVLSSLSCAAWSAPEVMECGESRQVQLEAGQISTITTSTGQPVHLEIREQGRNLVWRRHGDAAFQSIDLRPPRLGQVVVPLEGGDSLERSEEHTSE